MNNYRLKHLKLDAIGNQEILHDGLLAVITEIETKKAFFSEINALIHTVTARKMWFQDFGNFIIIVASIETQFDREPVENFSNKSLRSGEATYGKHH